MTNMNNTKRALFSSVVALVLCFTMLLGSTFAWFTDSVTSANNKITAGTLDVELKLWTSATDSVALSTTTQPILGGDNALIADAGELWEPGKTQVLYFSVENLGSLALKYNVAFEVKGGLVEVIDYAVYEDAQYNSVTGWNADNGSDLVVGTNPAFTSEKALYSEGVAYFAVALHMDEEAGNNYMDKTLEFDIRLVAGQLSYENDSFGNGYDALAAYPGVGYGELKTGDTAVEVAIRNEEEAKVGSVVVPAAAVGEGKKIEAKVTESAYKGNFTVAANETAMVVDVTVEGLVEGNTTPIKVSLRAPAGLDPEYIKVYHYSEEVEDFTYNPNNGYVTFETATFSPFTVIYDVEKVYTAPDTDENKLPTANVVEYVSDEEIVWGNYGQWSPTEGLESNLEAAYVFSCTETLEEAKLNPYANWYCDFYIVLDTDLGANEIFLGGNYGSFGWVGFHNGDLELEANTEIGLLESVTTNPWTYLDVVQNVGTFICGVGDVNDALAGATFTVMLRLTNPEDTTESVNVAKIEYTFTETVAE